MYYYTPIILTAIQREIGEKQMWAWLRTLLVTPTERTDYQFLFNTLNVTLNDPHQAKTLAARYFNDDQALANAIRVVQQRVLLNK
ncbi:hypothetical protein GCM10011383_45530 [Hymenobacter cavernae]|uniref:DUF4476 domain-containing protein n=1 Tax=Hymenobacter cavernae TaxID=2044852 RepID=A0ABQ1UWN1_9BACT|nr:hypothetical protein GCM10011383_45530 [Hymenobacter cavernae]